MTLHPNCSVSTGFNSAIHPAMLGFLKNNATRLFEVPDLADVVMSAFSIATCPSVTCEFHCCLIEHAVTLPPAVDLLAVGFLESNYPMPQGEIALHHDGLSIPLRGTRLTARRCNESKRQARERVDQEVFSQIGRAHV